ncbi:MAG: pentapeptide repeat-containing protein [Gloeomargarita sp. SKYBB_i_bin120]|nr:pentapeptide repeat-containing protein [Gloeomargarita sp. SKYG98]MCS7292095.1 pentapeptide repeat-containing protein [Gloeomargarita sp. SKYB120]MDW8177655.1 pentapeptide repeat-containing protein [Gloeomargarita sp. SKYBB_i_bin120]
MRIRLPLLTLGLLALFVLPAHGAEPEHVRQLLRTNKCTDCDLREADLQRMELRNADLAGSDLRRANLQEADLSGANLRNTDLRGANFRNANLRYADLRGADIRGADFTGANLTGTELEDSIRFRGFIDIPGRAMLRQMPPPVQRRRFQPY